jgi:hypothetical protein
MWTYKGSVYYCTVDGNGNQTSDIKSFEGDLSDCQPIIRSGNILWYVWDNEKVSFYTINLNNISKYEKKHFISGHSYSVNSVNGVTVSLRCSKCGDSSTGKIPSYFSIYWEVSTDGVNTAFSSRQDDRYHPNKTVKLLVDYDAADINDFEIISSDEGVAKIIDSDDGFALKTISEGKAKITIRSKYNTEIKTQYTINVSHDWNDTEYREATCTEAV